MQDKVKKAALFFSVLGIGSLLIVVISGAAYPSPIFQIGTAAGIVSCILALMLYVTEWGLSIYTYYRRGEKTAALITLALGLVVIGYAFWRIRFH